MPATTYQQPTTLAAATQLLAQGRWQPLAGGTDLYPAHVGRPIAQPLLDLSRIETLRGIREGAAGWWFGATTPWSEVLRASLPARFDALKAAAREVGGLQIQNTATIAGNLCNASPAADGTPVWLALDAQVLLASAAGERCVPVAQFVLGARRTARRDDELVTALHVPRGGSNARSVFLKLGGRRYLVISVTMLAALIETDAQGMVQRAAIAVGSCSAVAQRLVRLESRLLGQPAAVLASVTIEPDDLAVLTPIDDIRASAAYRLDATATLLRRGLRELAA